MADVTFPVEFGGDGKTYSDDADPGTGLANGGHRTRFVPALYNAVEMARWTKEKASETNSDRLIASQASAKAVSALGDSVKAASTATAAAENALTSARDASATYDSVSDGLDATTDGQFFQVAGIEFIKVYRNSGGQAELRMRLASQESLEAVKLQPDPLLTSLIFS